MELMNKKKMQTGHSDASVLQKIHEAEDLTQIHAESTITRITSEVETGQNNINGNDKPLVLTRASLAAPSKKSLVPESDSPTD